MVALKKYLGITLIILSAICWFAIFLLAYFQLSIIQVTAMTAVLIIAGEIFFWSGTILIGTELWTKFKKNLNPKYWFKKNNS